MISKYTTNLGAGHQPILSPVTATLRDLQCNTMQWNYIRNPILATLICVIAKKKFYREPSTFQITVTAYSKKKIYVTR
jgi:hypothetical protein